MARAEDVVFAAGAGLMPRSLWTMVTSPLGFDPAGVLTLPDVIPPDRSLDEAGSPGPSDHRNISGSWASDRLSCSQIAILLYKSSRFCFSLPGWYFSTHESFSARNRLSSELPPF
jgi:hypothetical protein